MNRYRVTLTAAERHDLEALGRTNRTGATKYRHARALLLCDSSDDRQPWTTAQITAALGLSPRTVEHLKANFVLHGLAAALERKLRATPPRPALFDGEKEARLIALACSPAPAGRARWTVRLLADRLVALAVVPTVSPATVHRTLKKTRLSLT